MKKENTLVSVIIPVKNGELTIEKCLKGLFSQTLRNSLEVILLDSGSTDSTLAIARRFSVVVYDINPKSFNHGETRNYGIKFAQGKYILFTVQDAWTEDQKLLERMVNHFEDENVVGVCGQQIVPHDIDKNPYQWFRPISEPEPRIYQYKSFQEFENTSASEKSIVAGWDNVIAMYRKSYLKSHPFEKTNFSEDIRWAYKSLRDGKSLVYDYRNRVCHYHYETSSYHYKRDFIENYQRFAIFGSKPKPFFKMYQSLVKMAALIIKKKLPFKWWFYNLKLIAISFYSDLEFSMLRFLDSKSFNINKKYLKLSKEIPQGKQNER